MFLILFLHLKVGMSVTFGVTMFTSRTPGTGR